MTATVSDRNRELARIHCLKKELGLDDDEYRDLMFTVRRVRSAADLDDGGRRQFIVHLQGLLDKRDDWAFIARSASDRQSMLYKIKALLKGTGRGKRYVEGITKKMFAIERLELCAPDHLHKVIAALNIDHRRRAN